MLRVNLTEEAVVPSKILAIFSDKTLIRCMESIPSKEKPRKGALPREGQAAAALPQAFSHSGETRGAEPGCRARLGTGPFQGGGVV